MINNSTVDNTYINDRKDVIKRQSDGFELSSQSGGGREMGYVTIYSHVFYLFMSVQCSISLYVHFSRFPYTRSVNFTKSSMNPIICSAGTSPGIWRQFVNLLLYENLELEH